MVEKDVYEGKGHKGGHSPVSRVRLDLGVAELTTNETLEREDGVRRVDDGLPLGGETDEALTVLRERDDRRCCPRTLSIFDHLRRLALHNGDTGVWDMSTRRGVVC